jgi:phosphatidylserine/phosphatidylglycerophosphate/cardiolipin synthase-like enzyme
MDPTALAQFFRQSLADRRLSGSEKTALSEWADQHIPDDQARGLARHMAFEIARESSADPNGAAVVTWLEEVMKVLAPIRTEETAVAPRGRGEGEKERACFSPGEQCLLQIIHRFDTCRHNADVCVFTITDDRISRSILDAHRRGVKLRIISDDDKWHDLGSDIQQFREAGIAVKVDDIHSQRDPHLKGHMHHKFAIFDGERLIHGSYNWTRSAANVNYENLVDTGDPDLIAAFAEEFKRLWNRF